MLIISKFRDYYDTAIAHGIDKECVYDRKTEEVNKPKYNHNDTTEFCTKEYTFLFTPYTIGFCGDAYRMVKVCVKNNYDTLDKKTLGFYDANSLIEYMKLHNIKLKNKRQRWVRWRSWYRDNWKTEEEIRGYYNRGIEQSTYNLFRKYNTPIFVKDYNCIYINPCLKDFKFAKIKDAYTAFQDIYQYIAGVLGNKEKNIISVSNKIRIKQYGFDKQSFRKNKKNKNNK